MSGEEGTKDSVWRIDREKMWPPKGQARPPVSPSLYQVIRACWLRATFASSTGYPRRTSPYARLGTAFHDTLEDLPGLVRSANGVELSEVRARAVEAFRQAVGKEKERALKNPREANDRWPEDQERRMKVQAALAAGHLAKQLRSSPHAETGPAIRPGVVLEETLVSGDGLLKGRPDRVEEGLSGVMIVDYKTGSLDDPERLERYEQQCLFYAWLWHDRHGVWPAKYRLVNPLTGKEHTGSVDPQAAEALAKDARRLALLLREDPPPAEAQASPGGACASCEFRPWCEPFWQRAARPAFEVPAYGDRKRVSVQGAVREVRIQTGGGSPQVFVWLRVETGTVTLQAPLPDFSHVGTLQFGERVRVLDALVSPEDEEWLRLDGWSEVFVLVR